MKFPFTGFLCTFLVVAVFCHSAAATNINGIETEITGSVNELTNDRERLYLESDGLHQIVDLGATYSWFEVRDSDGHISTGTRTAAGDVTGIDMDFSSESETA